jgi:hydrogenase maturation protein HypF
MTDFAMCPTCRVEYEDPDDRRFHAEPIACPECGPRLTYISEDEKIEDTAMAIEACVLALDSGQIVAIKGIGGYHLCCDALNQDAIQHLRVRKQRADKPLAVMFAEQGDDGLNMVRQYLKVNSTEQQQLLEPSRPIVLLEKIANQLPDNLAPNLTEIGAMLPYSPLHHILLKKLGRPMVATSANISGEPVLTDNEESETRLKTITRNFLHHNRRIQRPADDSLVRLNTNKVQRLRIGRGLTPIELTLPVKLSKPVLACGGQMKNTVALAWDDRIVISPHIGDLDSPRSQSVFEQVIADLQNIYQVKAEQLVCDAHQGYSSTRWAKQTEVPCSEVFHHYAHASVLAGEYPDVENWLVFTWDGVGLGDDGSLWGGEGLYGGPGNWQRLTSWRPFHLPGGDKAARQPWRSAAALCWEAGSNFYDAPDDIELLQQAWQKRVNTSKSTAVGRLFDAAASLTGICQQASFEGQAPMWLENAATLGQAEALVLPVVQNHQGQWQSDWQPLVTYLQDSSRSQRDRARTFHDSVARALVDQARIVRDHYAEFTVGLCGGVFQNRLLTETVFQELTRQDFRVLIPEKIPLNDGGLCYGQIIEFAASC